MILSPKENARIYGRRKPQSTLARARRLVRTLCESESKPLMTEDWIEWAARKIALFAERNP